MGIWTGKSSTDLSSGDGAVWSWVHPKPMIEAHDRDGNFLLPCLIAEGYVFFSKIDLCNGDTMDLWNHVQWSRFPSTLWAFLLPFLIFFAWHCDVSSPTWPAPMKSWPDLNNLCIWYWVKRNIAIFHFSMFYFQSCNHPCSLVLHTSLSIPL